MTQRNVFTEEFKRDAVTLAKQRGKLGLSDTTLPGCKHPRDKPPDTPFPGKGTPRDPRRTRPLWMGRDGTGLTRH